MGSEKNVTTKRKQSWKRTYDQGYVDGRRTALLRVIDRILLDYEIDTKTTRRARLEIERAETVSALRRLCEEHGDNDWPDDLHLGDVIEKHVYPGSGR